MIQAKAAFEAARIFFQNMNRYPGLFYVINATRTLSNHDSDALAVIVGKPMSNDDVDLAMAILDKYQSDATATPT